MGRKRKEIDREQKETTERIKKSNLTKKEEKEITERILKRLNPINELGLFTLGGLKKKNK